MQRLLGCWQRSGLFGYVTSRVGCALWYSALQTVYIHFPKFDQKAKKNRYDWVHYCISESANYREIQKLFMLLEGGKSFRMTSNRGSFRFHNKKLFIPSRCWNLVCIACELSKWNFFAVFQRGHQFRKWKMSPGNDFASFRLHAHFVFDGFIYET